jgi:hypothetical protein
MRFPIAVFVLLVGSHLSLADDFKPVTDLKDLEWLIGEHKLEGVILNDGDSRGTAGTPVDGATVKWEKFGNHYLLQTGDTTVNGDTRAEFLIAVRIEPETKQAEGRHFLAGGVRAHSKIFRSGNKFEFRAEGTMASGAKVKATVEWTRNDKGFTMRYTKLNIGGKDVAPLPPLMKATPIAK